MMQIGTETRADVFLDFLERCAFEALIDEVSTTPKPGLVDMRDNGAHRDMDFHSFEVSTVAIVPYIRKMAELGNKWRDNDKEGAVLDGEGLFLALRPIGMEAEQAMFQATGGVNTHKGMIFSMGLVAAAAGYLSAGGRALATSDAILRLAGQMCRRPVERDFEAVGQIPALTHGERIYLKYGCRGIRGEAADGFPSIRTFSLPALRDAVRGEFTKSGLSGSDVSSGLSDSREGWNRACLQTLLSLMANVEDTNVLYRCDYESLSYVRECAGRALALGGGNTEEGMNALKIMNEDFIEKNLSPGGCADLLAITIFLWKLERV